MRDEYKFASNNLIITNVDIQSVEPVDQRTRDALQRSVQMAIEITTKSQEASAKHEAERTVRSEDDGSTRAERRRAKREFRSMRRRGRARRAEGLNGDVEAEGGEGGRGGGADTAAKPKRATPPSAQSAHGRVWTPENPRHLCFRIDVQVRRLAPKGVNYLYS